jgi:rubredoxin
MRKLMLVAFSLLVAASAAMAQNKVDTKWHCPKSTAEHKYDVGDVADHSYVIRQGTCNATASDKGFAEKTGAYTEFNEAWKETTNWHGRYNVAMDNGDKVFYTYEGSGPNDITKPITNKWKISGGTGKHKGIKGSGTCAGTRNADGSADWACTGTYSMGK